MAEVKQVTPLIVVDMRGWRMKDYRHFMKATQESDFGSMFDILAKVVQSWPYDGNPTDPASYDELGMEDWLAVTKAVGAAMSNQFSQGN